MTDFSKIAFKVSMVGAFASGTTSRKRTHKIDKF